MLLYGHSVFTANGETRCPISQNLERVYTMTNFITSGQFVTPATITKAMWNVQTTKASQLALYGDFLQDAIQGAVCDALLALLAESSYDQLDHVMKSYTREFCNGGNQAYSCRSKYHVVDLISEKLSGEQLIILEGMSPEFATLLKSYDANVKKAQEEASSSKPPSTGQELPEAVKALIAANAPKSDAKSEAK